jgi:hypothetical protein
MMTPLDPKLRALVDLAEGELDPLPDDVANAVHARLTASTASGLKLVVIAGALVVAAVVAAVNVVRPAVERPPDVKAPSVAVEHVEQAPAPVEVVAPVAPAPPPVIKPPSETKLIDDARHAVHETRLDEATRLLRRHARIYPGGKLAEEREALLVLIAIRSNDPNAHAKRDAFASRYPQSLFVRMLEEASRAR